MIGFLRKAGTAAFLLFGSGATSAWAAEILDQPVAEVDPISVAADETIPRESAFRLVGDEQWIGEDSAIQKGVVPEECDGCDIDGCECCPPIWYASAGVVILKRNRPAPGVIVANNPGGAEYSNADDFEFQWDVGVDVTLARRIWNDDILEARYFGLDSQDNNSFVAPGSFIGTAFTGPGGTSFAGQYISRLDSIELNWRRAYTSQLTLLGGFRMLEVNDDMLYRLNGNVATGQYEYNNYLYGVQIGADLALTDRTNPFQLNLVGKAGYYGNFVAGGVFEFQGNNFIGSFVDQETLGSFVGEVGISGAYRITSCMAVRAGYQLLWIDNVALGSDAAARSLLNPALLRSLEGGDLFYHGATIALDVVW